MKKATQKASLIDHEWVRADGALGKFLHDAMSIIDDNLSIIEDEITIVVPVLFEELIVALNKGKIFDGGHITFMLPAEGINKGQLRVIASTKEMTREGEKMVGQPCGLIAQTAFESGVVDVKVIENKKQGKSSGRYKGKSYLYPIIDVDSKNDEKIRYGLIGISNLNKRYLPTKYIDLLVSMGEALGRQFGRVVERQKAKINLIDTNNQLREKTKELESALTRIETLLSERSKQVSLQTFLFGTINHDFKRALMAIMSQLESLPKNVGENVKKGLERIKRSVNDTMEIVKMIDHMGKINILIIPIHHFFEEYRHNAEYLGLIQNRKKAIKVTWDIDVTENVFFDPYHLKRVMNNIISNAIKYSPDGGEIHLASRVVGDKALAVEITISDQGVGINKDDLAENVFKTRWRSKSVKNSGIDGAGLGLSFVKYIVNKCNGEIKAESQPGCTNKAGVQFVTTFILSLPVCTPQEMRSVESLIKRNQRALVIGEKGDDNQYLNRDLQHIVEDLEQGLGVKDFENQKEAAEAIGSLFAYGIVVCMGMPDKNEAVIKAAIEANTLALCLDTENRNVYTISEKKKECVPADSFLIYASKFIQLG